MGSPSSNGGATANGRDIANGSETANGSESASGSATDHRRAISAELLASFDEAKAAELAHRLEEDDYPTPFAGLDDWHLLRALAIHRPDLAAPYVHLVDQEPFDED